MRNFTYNKEFLVEFPKINDRFTKAFEIERRLSDRLRKLI